MKTILAILLAFGSMSAFSQDAIDCNSQLERLLNSKLSYGMMFGGLNYYLGANNNYLRAKYQYEGFKDVTIVGMEIGMKKAQEHFDGNIEAFRANCLKR